MSKEILVKNSRMRDGRIVDILIKDGKFERIEENIEENVGLKGAEVIDVAGNLVSPPFCDSHLHLDATLSVGKPRYNMSGTLLEGIQIWQERKRTLSKETIRKNALEVIKWEIANGSTYIRTHADATDVTGNAVDALLEVREEVKDIIDMQIVAFPQDCIFTSGNGKQMLISAVEKGCDVVGGLPYMELSYEDGLEDVRTVFDIAEKYDRLVDIHCDENTDSQSRFVETMVRETIIRGMQGRVTASHTTAMHNYNNDFAQKLIGNLGRAEMNIVTNPYANSCLQNRTDGYPRHRGHTRVDELIVAGINVSVGSDDIMDPWYPMGKGSPLCCVNLLMNYAQLSGYEQIKSLFDMITVNAAKTLCIDDYGIEVGNRADMIVLDADSEFDAIRRCSEVLFTIRKGKVISRTVPAERIVSWKNDELEKVDFKVKDVERGR